jgi:hypothetical protein
MTAIPAPPQTRYAKSGGVSLAYQVVGEGPIDLVFCQGFVSNVDFWWEMPVAARLLRRLSSFSRLIIWRPATSMRVGTSSTPWTRGRRGDGNDRRGPNQGRQ